MALARKSIDLVAKLSKKLNLPSQMREALGAADDRLRGFGIVDNLGHCRNSIRRRTLTLAVGFRQPASVRQFGFQARDGYLDLPERGVGTIDLFLHLQV